MFVCFSVFLLHSTTVNIIMGTKTIYYREGIMWDRICMGGETVVTKNKNWVTYMFTRGRPHIRASADLGHYRILVILGIIE